MDTVFNNSIRVFLYFYFIIAILDVAGLYRLGTHIELLVTTVSWGFLIYGILKYKLNKASFIASDKLVIVLFLIWCIINIIRSIEIPILNPQSFPRYIGGSLFVPAWIVPFFVFYGSYTLIWKALWRTAQTFCKYFLLFSPFLFFYSRYYINLAWFIPLLILNWDAVSKKNKFIIAISFSVALIFLAYNSERANFMRLIFYILAYYLILFFHNVPQRLSKIFVTTIVLGLSIFMFSLLYNGTISSYISDPIVKANLESFEKSNFNNSSREYVYPDFVRDFNKTGDWFLGRGVLGTTYSEEFAIKQMVESTNINVFNFPPGYRPAIEMGYLLFIVKAGLLGVILLSIISLRAIFLALFISNNYFVKGCALIIIEWLISMYPAAIPEYNFAYILFWLCIGACLSKEVRFCTNEEISALIFDSVNTKAAIKAE